MRFREVEKIILADGWEYKTQKAHTANTPTHQNQVKSRSRITLETLPHKLLNKSSNRPGYRSPVLTHNIRRFLCN